MWISRCSCKCPTGVSALAANRNVGTTFGQADQIALDFMKAEYDSLRGEGAQARQAQQSILQWSMAILGVVFSAGILVANQSMNANTSPSAQGFLHLVFLLVFGVVLPLSSWCATLAWFGELIRMERVGRYLRGFEVALGEIMSRHRPSGDPAFPTSPLRWENHISGERRGVAVSKQRVGYLGCLGLYAGVVAVPLTVALIRVWRDPLPWMGAGIRTAFTAYATLVLSGFTVTLVIITAALQRAGRQAADLSAVVPGARRAAPERLPG
ncbi:hypothetical protein ACFXGA_21030 [Actinosynnema sp. NPDC059335]|uniref:hypothetical protein n=1 Tax=Actinosynnema sp. NPDC059335 TaxID=3346804 RepID=UPI00366F921D